MRHVQELLARDRSDLTAAERQQIDAHVATCAECRAFAADLVRTDRLLKGREPYVSIPPFGARPGARGRSTFFGLATVGAVAVFAILVLVPILAGLGDRAAAPSVSPAPTVPTAPVLATASAVPSATASTPATGTITGRLGYPSDFVPPLTVYAISVSDPSVWFATSTPTFGNAAVSPAPGAPPSPTWPPTGPGTYVISGVAPGNYWVIAYRNDIAQPSQNQQAPGAYTQRGAKCLSVDASGATPPPGPCQYDSTLIPVTVTAGQTTTHIDIVDWLFQGGRYPARPTPR